MIFRRKLARSNVGDIESLGASAAPSIDFRGDRVDAVAVDIEGTQQAYRIELQIRLHLPERIRANKERIFHGAVIAPEADRVPGRIVAAGFIRKIDRHVRGLARLRLPWEAHHCVLAAAGADLNVACVIDTAVPWEALAISTQIGRPSA